MTTIKIRTERTNGIPLSSRNQGVPHEQIETAPPSREVAARRVVGRKRQVLLALLDEIRPDGSTGMSNRAELKASANTMQEMYYDGMVSGAGSRDSRGLGNTPESSWWWLTTMGELYARALK